MSVSSLSYLHCNNEHLIPFLALNHPFEVQPIVRVVDSVGNPVPNISYASLLLLCFIPRLIIIFSVFAFAPGATLFLGEGKNSFSDFSDQNGTIYFDRLRFIIGESGVFNLYPRTFLHLFQNTTY